MSYQVMPDLTDAEYAELKADIVERGVKVPIEYDELGNVLDGHHRLRICNELGIKDFPKVIRAGLSESEKYTHARKLNILRRHLTQEQRRELIREQLKETPEKSDRQIADEFKVSHVTVGAQRAELEGCGQIDHVSTITDTLGREQPRQRKPVSIFNPTPQEEKAVQKNPAIVEKVASGEAKTLTQAARQERQANIENQNANREAQGKQADLIQPQDVNPIKMGDVIKVGKQTVICGNFLDIDVLKYRPTFIYADPPYGMHLDTDFSSMEGDSGFNADKNTVGGKKHGSVIGDHGDFDFTLIANCLKLPMRECFLWGANYYCENMPDKNKGSWIVWDKRLDEKFDEMFGSAFELCWSVNKHKQEIARIRWAGIFGTEQEHDHKRYHPTQKPTALAMWFLERYAESGDVILDPFCGSGSALLACEKMGYSGIGIEVNPEYAAIAVSRLESLCRDMKND